MSSLGPCVLSLHLLRYLNFQHLKHRLLRASQASSKPQPCGIAHAPANVATNTISRPAEHEAAGGGLNQDLMDLRFVSGEAFGVERERWNEDIVGGSRTSKVLREDMDKGEANAQSTTKTALMTGKNAMSMKTKSSRRTGNKRKIRDWMHWKPSRKFWYKGWRTSSECQVGCTIEWATEKETVFAQRPAAKEEHGKSAFETHPDLNPWLRVHKLGAMTPTTLTTPDPTQQHQQK
ncbi:hypothetical protein BKA70DRAFT_1240260 [Coprinopsis sp. MPI-PUGE-AT-0042]|nr:hypothetical protein BKA70DRAFT_1240260 [Coprinopsis sp. MPI-PUGE-AT-0042]